MLPVRWRRILPWALLGLLMVGVAAGATLGQVQSPGVSPAQWVEDVLNATVASATAHVQTTSVITSPDPSQDGATLDVGVIDLTNGDYRLNGLYRGGGSTEPGQVSDEEIVAIGKTVYENQSESPGWSVFSYRHLERATFGIGITNEAWEALSTLGTSTPAAAVHTFGPDSVDGVIATRYVITYAPVPFCGAQGRILLARRPPTTIWVDGYGRLLRVRSMFHMKGYVALAPAGYHSVRIAATTTVATVTFSDFGAPVHISAPAGSGPPEYSLVAPGPQPPPCSRISPPGGPPDSPRHG